MITSDNALNNDTLMKYLEDAFIFSLDDGKGYDNIILSRAKYNESLIYTSDSSLIGFTGLKWFSGKVNTYEGGYEKKIIPRWCNFIVKDYEVFQVVKK